MTYEEAKETIDNMSEEELNEYVFFALKEMTEKCEKQQTEIEKKDNIINLMADQLTTPIHSKEWVIEYYTKKIEMGEK